MKAEIRKLIDAIAAGKRPVLIGLSLNQDEVNEIKTLLEGQSHASMAQRMANEDYYCTQVVTRLPSSSPKTEATMQHYVKKIDLITGRQFDGTEECAVEIGLSMLTTPVSNSGSDVITACKTFGISIGEDGTRIEFEIVEPGDFVFKNKVGTISTVCQDRFLKEYLPVEPTQLNDKKG